MPTPLPPGQRDTPDIPRFGLAPCATRFPSQTERIHLHSNSDSARARGMRAIAKASGRTREALYQALRPDAQPRFDTI